MRCMCELMEARLQMKWTEGRFLPPGGMGYLFFKLSLALPGSFAMQSSLKTSLAGGFGMEVGGGLACPLCP